jgi:hypothetical protein
MLTIRLTAVSDPHLRPSGAAGDGTWHNRLEYGTALPRLEIALQQCTAAGPSALLALGDIADLGDGGSLDAAVERFAAVGTTSWLVGGNHDTRGPGGGRALDEAVRRAGTAETRVPPPGGVGWMGMGIAGVPLSPANEGYRSRLTGGLGQGLSREGLLLVLSHFPLVSLRHEVEAAGWKYPGDLVDLTEVVRPVLERTGPTVVLHGHLHLGSSRVHGRLLQIGCPPLIEAPFEIMHVAISTDGHDAVEVALRREQIWSTDGVASWPQMAPRREAWRYDGSGWIPVEPDDAIAP